MLAKEFYEFIELKVDLRYQELIKSQNLGISAKSRLIKIFKDSQSISSVKEKSIFLLFRECQNPQKIKWKLITGGEER